MKTLWLLTFKSILNRKTAVFLSIVSIAISVVLLLGIDRVTKASKEHFLNTINQTDLIVAAPNGSLDILLNLVFHLGDPLKEVDYTSYQAISKFDEVKWAVPLSVGDSFKGYDAVSTTNDYFKYYRYSSSQELEFAKGGEFKDFYDVVVGSDVAKELRLHLRETIHLSHSSGKHAHAHKNRDFHICGILKPTGTPNDQSVFFQLKADEAIHIEWQSGHFVDMHISSKELENMHIQPKHISGILIGLKNRTDILNTADKIEHYKGENLKAAIPAKALSKLYRLMKNIQEMLSVISGMVFLAAIFGMISTMLATLNDRRREIAILRSLGANIKAIFSLFAMEAFIIVTSGIIAGNMLLAALILINNSFLNEILQIAYLPDMYEISLLFVMIVSAVAVSVVPAVRSYKNSLQDGLMVKI
ncbi:FtsX-like permease family protein [Sulfurimonas sp. HSL-1716]|uniref:ABC transporter permease n=1 Tax=Hydrocurvibacter sulfurireducens TaxID=3131937 RepID=UPI0031F9F617